MLEIADGAMMLGVVLGTALIVGVLLRTSNRR
jgi:hypothetical protein